LNASNRVASVNGPQALAGRGPLRESSAVSEPAVGARATLLFVVNVAWFFLSHRLPLARAAMAAGFRVHLASDVEDPSETREVQSHGIEFHRVNLTRSGLNPLGEVNTLRELCKIVRRVQPDIVHNVTSKPVIYGTRVARAFRTAGIVNAISGFGHVYGSQSRLRWLVDRAYAGSFRPQNVRIIVQNEADRSEVLQLCPASGGRVHLIPGSGVDLVRFRPSPEPVGTPTVLLAARLLGEKGIREFAAAAAELRAARCPARFVVAGRLDPANRGALSAQEMTELADSSGVQWLGDCRDMPRCLREAHIVCLPSYYREGVPKVLLEACAAGRAIVTTDAPGCRDAVRQGENGLLVPPRDVAALATAIRRLLADPPLRSRMGVAGRARAEREFGIERVVHSHLELYRELSEHNRGAL
jgi:glycosyltransferase involved in cell wall biosynthesis